MRKSSWIVLSICVVLTVCLAADYFLSRPSSPTQNQAVHTLVRMRDAVAKKNVNAVMATISPRSGKNLRRAGNRSMCSDRNFATGAWRTERMQDAIGSGLTPGNNPASAFKGNNNVRLTNGRYSMYVAAWNQKHDRRAVVKIGIQHGSTFNFGTGSGYAFYAGCGNATIAHYDVTIASNPNETFLFDCGKAGLAADGVYREHTLPHPILCEYIALRKTFNSSPLNDPVTNIVVYTARKK